MDAQQFLAEFGHIANAPGSVARLRDLVLQLAAQGKLVGPSEMLASSSELLDRVRETRSQRVADKKLPREKQYPSISDAGGAARGPQHWRWAYFGEVWHLLSGRDLGPTQYNESRSGIPYITGASNIENGVIAVNRWTSEPVVISTAGDLLITCKGTIGKTAFNNIGDVHIARQIMAIRGFTDELDSQFLKIWLDGFVDELVKKSKSMIPGFSRDDLIFAAYPIFPLEEQSRIVAKVDELMALCDRLEQQQQDRRKLQNGLRQSTLQALASAESPHELQESWQRLQANFGTLFSEPGDVRPLRDVLFDLALRGLLLSSSRLALGDDPASDELGSLPVGWAWKTLADFSEYITSGSRGWKSYMTSTGDSFIRSQDIRQDALIFESPAYVTLPERVEGKRTLVRAGDVLLTITGGNVGRCAVVPELTNKAYVSQHVALIRLHDPSLSEFIHFWMINAFGGRAFLARYIYGDKPGLNLAQVGSVPVPVPPASVLPQILASLRRLQELCDAFGKQLKTKCELAERLSTASVARISGITLTATEDFPVKAPQTELLAPLRLGTLPDVRVHAPLATLLARHHGEMSARDLWQRFGGEIDSFYVQLKTEVTHGWIEDPSYELDPNAPAGPKTYPDGALVAKMKIKQEA